jgi:hypothetical protein
MADDRQAALQILLEHRRLEGIGGDLELWRSF